MKKTRIYGLGYFEAGDRTSELLDIDINRFQTIDRNIYHLYSIFGNGVLTDKIPTSWELRPPSDRSKFQVLVLPGEGHVAWKYCSTDQSVTIDLPLSLSTFPVKYFIYATANATTPSLGTVDFVASLVEINNPNNFVGLGTVTINVSQSTNTNSGYTFSFTDEGRVEIELIKTLENYINRHVHKGGSKNPSQIDLRNHVTGKLSGEFIENLDASKITKGTISAERLPQIDHNDLSNKGTLTHTEIDSLLANLNYPTTSRLSDIFIANMLQLTLALKKQTDLEYIDKNLINVIMYQPGYNKYPNGTTDDSFVAFYENFDTVTSLTPVPLSGVTEPFVPEQIALAKIDKTNHQIVGGNPTEISADNVFWRTDNDFQNVYDETVGTGSDNSKFIEIIGSDDPAYFTLKKPYGFINFANDYSTGTFPSADGWKFGFVITSESEDDQIAADAYRYRVFRGSSGQTVSYDLTGVNKFGISYRVFDAETDVYIYLVFRDNVGGEAVNLLEITGQNTTTPVTFYKSQNVLLYDSSSNEDMEEEDIKSFNISSFTTNQLQLKNVIGFGFKYVRDYNLKIRLLTAETNDQAAKLSTSEFSRAQFARVNDIEEENHVAQPDSSVFVWNELYYYPKGQLIFRFEDLLGSPNYTTVYTDSFEPLNSNINIFTKIGTSEGAGIYQSLRSDGSIVPGTGDYISIKVELESLGDRTVAPTVDLVALTYVRAGESNGKTWDTTAEFQNEGRTFLNVAFANFASFETLDDPNGNYLKIDTIDQVGSFRFIKHSSTGQGRYYNATDSTETIIYNNMNGPITSGSGLSGLYSTPNQIWNKQINGLGKARDAFVLSNNHIVFADTDNDRVVEVDSEGYFVRAIQGNLRLKRNTRDLVALTSYYNPVLGYLYICFSQYIRYSSSLSSNIKIQYGDQIITFDTPGVTVSFFKPVTSNPSVANNGAGNGKPDLNSSGRTTFNESKSPTLIVSFTDSLKTIINSWDPTQIYVYIEQGVITSYGSDQIPYSAPSTSTDPNNGTNLPSYIELPKKLYKNVGTGPLASTKFVSYKGLITDPPVILDGDFDDSGTEPTETSTQLLFPEQDFNRVKIFVGNVVMDNLYSPVSIQVIDSNEWVVASAGEYSVSRYSSNGFAIEGFRIPYSTIAFTEGKGGSAYLKNIGNNLNSRKLFIAAPSQSADSTDGKIVFINQYLQGTNYRNTIVFSLNTLALDAVRVLPDPDNLSFWVALDDSTNNGISSQLVKYDSAGNTKLVWGPGFVQRPTGLSFSPSGDILISG